ncbi:molybdopterin cofactor-binding domain-containing protein [Dankookia sp. P2]|uniref:molybdopterin cofactor-binding domain-containing protein n=1 Tax=Dankookia sp. P2 TaxID=3423955 RepID=UPI003D67A222
MSTTLTRRGLGAAAAGLTLLFSLSPAGAATKLPGSLETNRRLDAWLRIDPDGTVTVCTGKVEIGQGAVTALMQIAAEELDVAPARIRMVSGDTALTPDEGFTAGSQSMEYGGTALRYAAAEVRAILLGLAAEKLGVPAASLTVQDGAISRAGRRGHDLLGGGAGEDAGAGGDGERRAEAARPAPDRRHQPAAARHPGQGHRRRHLRAGHAPARDAVRPRRPAAELPGDAGLGRPRRGAGDAGGGRGGAGRPLPRRRRRARGAGGEGPAGAARRGEVGGAGGAARPGPAA